MKAISLWQPWATAIALGSKTIETRHWPTNYRGPLAIHAAKRINLSELEDIAMEPAWMGALWPIFSKLTHNGFKNPKILRNELPLGSIVATCTMVDCRPTESFSDDEICSFRYAPDGVFCWHEADMGNFERGRFGWVLQDIKALPVPIPYKGAQGFFDVPDAIFKNAHEGVYES